MNISIIYTIYDPSMIYKIKYIKTNNESFKSRSKLRHTNKIMYTQPYVQTSLNWNALCFMTV